MAGLTAHTGRLMGVTAHAGPAMGLTAHAGPVMADMMGRGRAAGGRHDEA